MAVDIELSISSIARETAFSTAESINDVRDLSDASADLDTAVAKEVSLC